MYSGVVQKHPPVVQNLEKKSSLPPDRLASVTTLGGRVRQGYNYPQGLSPPAVARFPSSLIMAGKVSAH